MELQTCLGYFKTISNCVGLFNESLKLLTRFADVVNDAGQYLHVTVTGKDTVSLC